MLPSGVRTGPCTVPSYTSRNVLHVPHMPHKPTLPLANRSRLDRGDGRPLAAEGGVGAPLGVSACRIRQTSRHHLPGIWPSNIDTTNVSCYCRLSERPCSRWMR